MQNTLSSDNLYSLRNLLGALISAQDDVTHLNEMGSAYTRETKDAIQERENIRSKILELLDTETE